MLLRPPIHRLGGKKYLTTSLSQHIPQHTLYCEPFCGAGHLLFSKLQSKVEIINDIDGHLIGFFEVIKDDTKRQRLIRILNDMPYSRTLWRELRLHWKQGNISSDLVDASAQWFYLNRTCFSGDQVRGGFAVPSATGRNPAQSFRTAINTFEDIARRLRNVTIENLSYVECIQRYDSQDSFFYCDPPYLNAEHYYGKDSFSQEDHYRLAELLHGVKGKIMVSHYANELYDNLYAGWNRYEYQSFKGSHKAGNGESKTRTTECLWTNFEPERKTRSLFNGYA
ncbi:MAG: hypothetical protein B6D35_09690 [Candidatus Brocadia sp. UTAMX2]|jgi:DNA adenine methylase|nr:MAG: hypothetical protein B6D35_09690 [Candidatus Brocadia sp. UTAMX2]